MLYNLHLKAYQNTIIKLSLPKSYLLLSSDHTHLQIHTTRKAISKIIRNYQSYKKKKLLFLKKFLSYQYPPLNYYDFSHSGHIFKSHRNFITNYTPGLPRTMNSSFSPDFDGDEMNWHSSPQLIKKYLKEDYNHQDYRKDKIMKRLKRKLELKKIEDIKFELI